LFISLKRWRLSGKQDPAELQWMSKHALRTLVKQGHRDALKFLGFEPNPRIVVAEFAIHAPNIKPGDAIEFSFTVTAKQDASRVALHYVASPYSSLSPPT